MQKYEAHLETSFNNKLWQAIPWQIDGRPSTSFFLNHQQESVVKEFRYLGNKK